MHIKKYWVLIVIILSFVLLMPITSLSQEIIDIDYKIQTNIPLKVSEISEIRSLDMVWINDEKLVFREDRQVTMYTNPDNPEISKDVRMTNFLWDFGEGKYSNITHIEELDIIVLVEETPDPSLQVFNLEGVYVKTILGFITGEDYKAEYIQSAGKILILANKRLFLYDYGREETIDLAEDVYDFKYYPQSNEIFALINNDDTNPNDKRREFDLSIIDPKKNDVKFSESNITDFKYYPDSDKLMIAKSESFNSAKIIEINYPKNQNNRKEFKTLVAYKDFLNNEVVDRITGRLKNKMYLDYIPDMGYYIWAETEQSSNDTNIDNKKTIYLSDNPFEQTNKEYMIEEIQGYNFNHIKNDLALFSSNGTNTQIELVQINKDNISDAFSNENRILITDKSINTRNFFKWNYHTNIMFFIESRNQGIYIIAYSIDEGNELFSKGPVSDIDNIYIEIVDNEVIAISYINESYVGISELYHIPLDKNTKLLENTYYSIPSSTYGTVATIRKIDESKDETGTLALSFYESILTYEKIDREPSIIGAFGIGAKVGGAFNTSIGGYNFPDFGIGISIFGNMELFDRWLIEVGFGFENRNLTYSGDRSDWLLQNVQVVTNLLSISLLAKYKLSSLYYLPFGIRGNYTAYAIGQTEDSSGQVFPFEFEEYVNKFTFDVMGGAGINFIINERTDVFTELMLVFNVYPPLIKPSIVTGPGIEEGDQSNAFYLGVLLNIGITAYKFGIVEEEEQEIDIGPINIGFKVGVGSSAVPGIIGNTLNFSYEPAIFADIALIDDWFLEMDLSFYGRRLSFSSDINTGLTNDITVVTNMMSVNLLLKYELLAFHFPFGLKINYVLNSLFYVDNTPYDFSNNVNDLTYDLVAGGGASILLFGDVELITELLLILNLTPTFLKESFITGETVEEQKMGRFFGLQINIGANILQIGKDEQQETVELDLGKFSFGGKISGSIDTLFVYSALVNLGFEFSVYGGLNITDNWYADLNLLYGRRNIDIDEERANLTNSKNVIVSDILGIQLGGRYVFGLGNVPLTNENSMGIFIPFGLRSNIHLRSVIYTDTSEPYDFNDNVNNMSIDILTGIGYIYYLDETKDIFAELIVIANVAPEFYDASIFTINRDGEQIPGRFLGFQLNLGFTFWKF